MCVTGGFPPTLLGKNKYWENANFNPLNPQFAWARWTQDLQQFLMKKLVSPKTFDDFKPHGAISYSTFSKIRQKVLFQVGLRIWYLTLLLISKTVLFRVDFRSPACCQKRRGNRVTSQSLNRVTGIVGVQLVHMVLFSRSSGSQMRCFWKCINPLVIWECYEKLSLFPMHNFLK